MQLILQETGSGEDGIRTHAPRRTNGFQDRLVMTASIPLRMDYSSNFRSAGASFSLAQANDMLTDFQTSVKQYFSIFRDFIRHPRKAPADGILIYFFMR
jgi:hypothetical protein